MKRILCLLLFALLWGGCNKYIDIPEKGKVIPRTVKDYYELLCDYRGMTMSANNMYYMSDDIKLYKDEVGRIFFGAEAFTNGYLWKDYIYLSTQDNDEDWNTFYAQVYVCNVVLSKIDAAEGNDETLRRTAKGEALAQRAFAYFMLVNLYAKHYNTDTYASDLAVPLYLEPDINAAKGRATVKEVYELVEKDLLAALDLLPETTPFNYHPTRAGVQGLLAKLYLYQGKYEQARSYAEKALEVNAFLYDYNDFDFTPGLPKFLGLAGYPFYAKDNRECLWHKEASLQFVYMIAVYMSDEHLALYDEGDRRLYFSVIDAGVFGKNTHGGVLFAKDRVYRAGVYTPELYLIRAECNARLSQPAAAINDLNALRSKRFNRDKYVPYSPDKTPLEALQLVLKERRIELFQESWRWFDLKRLNLDPRFRKTLTRNFGGQTYTLAPDANNYVLPVPKRVIMLNGLLEQNPRDNKQ